MASAPSSVTSWTVVRRFRASNRPASGLACDRGGAGVRDGVRPRSPCVGTGTGHSPYAAKAPDRLNPPVPAHGELFTTKNYGAEAPGSDETRSAIDCSGLPATMKWSSARTSTSAAACLSVCVRYSSARDGSVALDGWSCTRSRVQLLRRSASRTTSCRKLPSRAQEVLDHNGRGHHVTPALLRGQQLLCD